MNISKIISISGKPGLYKLISQTKNLFIVECLIQSKRFTISSKKKINLIENISIYTKDEKEISLNEILIKISEKEKKGPSLDAKENYQKLRAYFKEILPNHNEKRLYESDLRKIFRWYNILQSIELISTEPQKKEN